MKDTSGRHPVMATVFASFSFVPSNDASGANALAFFCQGLSCPLHLLSWWASLSSVGVLFLLLGVPANITIIPSLVSPSHSCVLCRLCPTSLSLVFRSFFLSLLLSVVLFCFALLGVWAVGSPYDPRSPRDPIPSFGKVGLAVLELKKDGCFSESLVPVRGLFASIGRNEKSLTRLQEGKTCFF